MFVLITPGHRAVTPMLWLTSSMRSVSARLTMAALVTLYGAMPGMGMMPAPLAVIRTDPCRRSIMPGTRR